MTIRKWLPLTRWQRCWKLNFSFLRLRFTSRFAYTRFSSRTRFYLPVSVQRSNCQQWNWLQDNDGRSMENRIQDRKPIPWTSSWRANKQLKATAVTCARTRLSVKNEDFLGEEMAEILIERHCNELRRCSQFYSLASIFDEKLTEDKHQRIFKNLRFYLRHLFDCVSSSWVEVGQNFCHSSFCEKSVPILWKSCWFEKKFFGPMKWRDFNFLLKSSETLN